MFRNIETHGFLVDDVDNAIKNYSKDFDFPLIKERESFGEFDTGESEFGFFVWGYDYLAEHLGKEAMDLVKHKLITVIVYETKEEVDKAYETLKDRGVTFIAKPQEWEWGYYATYFVDVNGFIWEMSSGR